MEFIKRSIVILIVNLGPMALAQYYDENDTGFNSNYNQQSYNSYDPNRLLNGFFPLWSMYMLGLAGNFFR